MPEHEQEPLQFDSSPVTSAPESDTIGRSEKDQTSFQGGREMAQESNREPLPDGPPDRILARHIAELAGSKDPQDQRRLSELRAELAHRAQKEAGMLPPSEEVPGESHADKMRRLDAFYRRRGGPSNLPKSERPEL